MSTAFPTSIDSLPNPVNSTGTRDHHPNLHTDTNDAIIAIETVIGVSGSSDPSSIEYRLAAAVSVAYAAADSAALAATEAISALAAAALVSTDLTTHSADTSAHGISATVAAAITAHGLAPHPHGVYALSSALGTAAAAAITDFEPAGAVSVHAANTGNPHGVTAAQAGADAVGTAATLIAAHEIAPDPHSVYPLESDLGTAAFLDVGTTVGDVVQVQTGGKLPALDGSLLTGLPGGGDLTEAAADLLYAPIAKGVTNGDAHDHNGGDGAQIAYASLSGLPTLGTAAAAATGDFEAAGAVSTHNAVTTAHGISAWGATLVDDADANTARSTLGLGTASTTASTAYEASGAVSAHSGGTGVHTIAGVTGLQGALDAKSPTASPTFTGTVGGITAAMVGAPSGSGTSTGTNTGDAATPAETTTSIGALLNGATSKTTPVDADRLALWSSVSGFLEYLSWANLKTALSSLFVLLSGKSGGQTVIGGTAASENLTLQSTSHATKGKVLLGSGSAYDGVNDRIGVGVTSPSAKIHAISTTEQLRLGFDAENYILATVNATGVPAFESTSGQYTFKGGTGTAPLGSELITNGAFTSDISGWTDSGSTWSWSSGTALHTAGSASTLSQSVTVTSGTSYQLEFVMVGRTTGSVTVTLGSVTANKGGTTAFTSSTQVSLTAAASGSVTLSIIPTADFNGGIDDVTLKSIGGSAATMSLLNSSGSVVYEIRSNSYNNATGTNAQYSLTTGSYNNATGNSAQYSLTTGSYNNATGYNAQRSLTTGSYNNANGASAQYSLTTGSYNSANGASAQYSLTTGINNNANGNSAQYSLTTGINNNATGNSAQRSLTNGSSNNATGYAAQYSLTTGSYNNATGYSAQYSLTTGSSNNATGYNAQRYLTTGGYNNATGTNAQYYLTTGNYNNATGYNAQRYLEDGVTAATGFSSCTHIGDGTRVSADSVTNETAIGSGAIGLGSNTCTIGSAAVTRTGLRGSVEIIAESSTTIAQSQAGVSASWVDSTHTTRKARGILIAWDYSGGREAFRFEADGTQIKTSVNGVPAAPRAAVLTAEIPGDATRDELRLTELYNACKNFGIIN